MKRLMGALLAGMCMVVMLFPGTAMADAAAGGEYNYQHADFYVVVDASDGYVNFRYGPGLEYGINYPIYNGEVLYIEATADNYYDGLYWGYTTYGGDTGWISLSETSYMEDSPDPYYADTYPVSYAVIVDAVDGYVNLREGPGLAYDAQKLIFDDTVLNITAEGYNTSDGVLWGETEFEGISGWIALVQTRMFEPDPEAGPGTDQKSNNTGYLVTDAYYSESEKDNLDLLYAIPQINLDGYEIQQLNKTIYDTLYPMIEGAINDFSPADSLLESSYIWYMNGDILSLVIYNRFGGPWHEYMVYNISISDEHVLDKREFLSAAGWTESQYTQLVQEALEKGFDLLNQNILARGLEADQEAAFNECREETLSIYNIADCMPYMNGQGKVCIIGKINMFQSQNGCSWTDLNLTDPANNVETQAFFVTVKAPEGFAQFREGPGDLFDLIDYIPYGQKLYIIQTEEDGKEGITWGKTSWNGMQGWVPLGK